MEIFWIVLIILVVSLIVIGWIITYWEDIKQATIGCLTLLVIAGMMTAIIQEESRIWVLGYALLGFSMIAIIGTIKKLMNNSREKREKQQKALLDFYVLLLIGYSEKWQILGQSLPALQRAINFETQALEIQTKYHQLNDLMNRQTRYKQEKKVLECKIEISNIASQILDMLHQTVQDLEKDKEIKELRKEHQNKLQEAETNLDKFCAYQEKSNNKFKELENIKANCEYLMKVSYGEGLRQEFEKVCEHLQHTSHAKQEMQKIIDAQQQKLTQIVDNMRNHIINKKTLGQIMELSLSSPEEDGILAQAQAIMEWIDQEWAFDQRLKA